MVQEECSLHGRRPQGDSLLPQVTIKWLTSMTGMATCGNRYTCQGGYQMDYIESFNLFEISRQNVKINV